MKKLMGLVLASAIILMAACSDANSGDPKVVTKKFFEALKTMQLEEAEKYATKDSKSMLDLMKMAMSFAPNSDSIQAELKKQKIDYSDAVIKDDEATVTVTVNDKETTNFKLVKEEGQWKVAFDKSTLMQIGMDKAKDDPNISEQELEEAKEALETLNSDSLKKMIDGAGDAMKEAGKAIEQAGEKLKEKQ